MEKDLFAFPLVEDRCEQLGLDLMIGKNTAIYETPFTVSVDLIGHGCTTGISASDRAKTIKALVDPETKSEDLGRPGHIFPLKARKERCAKKIRTYRSCYRFGSACWITGGWSNCGNFK